MAAAAVPSACRSREAAIGGRASAWSAELDWAVTFNGMGGAPFDFGCLVPSDTSLSVSRFDGLAALPPTGCSHPRSSPRGNGAPTVLVRCGFPCPWEVLCLLLGMRIERRDGGIALVWVCDVRCPPLTVTACSPFQGDR